MKTQKITFRAAQSVYEKIQRTLDSEKYILSSRGELCEIIVLSELDYWLVHFIQSSGGKNIVHSKDDISSNTFLSIDEGEDGAFAKMHSEYLGILPKMLVCDDEVGSYFRWWKYLPDHISVIGGLRDKWGTKTSIIEFSSPEFISAFCADLGEDRGGLRTLFWTEAKDLIEQLAISADAYTPKWNKKKKITEHHLHSSIKSVQTYQWGGGADEYYSTFYTQDIEFMNAVEDRSIESRLNSNSAISFN